MKLARSRVADLISHTGIATSEKDGYFITGRDTPATTPSISQTSRSLRELLDLARYDKGD